MTEPRDARRSPSMADVAKRAGVSHQTVSRVLDSSPLVPTVDLVAPEPVVRASTSAP